MSIADWFRPKWKHSDPDVRRKAVEALADQLELADIAKNDEYSWVRQVAVGRVTNQSLLADIAKSDQNSAVREAAVERMTD